MAKGGKKGGGELRKIKQKGPEKNIHERKDSGGKRRDEKKKGY